MQGWYCVGLGFDSALLPELKEFMSTHSTMVSMLGSGRWYMGKRHQIRAQEPHRFGEKTSGLLSVKERQMRLV